MAALHLYQTSLFQSPRFELFRIFLRQVAKRPREMLTVTTSVHFLKSRKSKKRHPFKPNMQFQGSSNVQEMQRAAMLRETHSPRSVVCERPWCGKLSLEFSIQHTAKFSSTSPMMLSHPPPAIIQESVSNDNFTQTRAAF